MMSVLEYAQDISKKPEEVLEMCKRLDINVSSNYDMLDDDSIVLLDNAFENEQDEEENVEVDEEIIRKLDEDDYYDEVVDTLVDKKHTDYKEEQTKRIKYGKKGYVQK